MNTTTIKRFIIRAAPFLVVVCCVGAFWWNSVLFNRPQMLNDAAGDILRLHLPNIMYFTSTLREGSLPLWNPYEFCGMPMFAGLEFGPLYPPNWSFMFLPPDVGHLAGACFHQLLLMAGTWLFLRQSCRVSRWSATFGALCIGFSGWSTFRMLTEFDAYRSAAYIPWVLLLADRVLARPTWGRIVTLACALTLQLFAGEIEIWVRTLQVLCAFTFLRLATLVWVKPADTCHPHTCHPAMCHPERSEGSGGADTLHNRKLTSKSAIRLAWKPAAALLAAVILAIGLSAMQLLPTYEASQLSLRSSEGMSFEQAFRGGIAEPAEFLTATILYDHANHGYYLGMLAVALAVFAIAAPTAETLFFAALAFLAFSLMLGEQSWIAYIYYALPTGDLFRAPIRFLPYFVFSISILAALGFETLLKTLADPALRTRRIVAAVLFAVMVAFAVVNEGADSAELMSLLIAVALIGAMLLMRRLRFPTRSVRGPSALALTAALLATPFLQYDLLEFNIPKNPDFIGPPRDALSSTRPGMPANSRIYTDYAFELGRRQPKIGVLTKIPAINGISPFMPRSFWKFIAPYQSSRIKAAQKRDGKNEVPALAGIWGGLALDQGAQEALDILGVRYIVTGPGSELQYGEFGDVAIPGFMVGEKVEHDFTLYENMMAWQRAFVVRDTAIESMEELRKAYINGAPAAIALYTPNHVRVTTNGVAGMVVLTDQHYPGWVAEVNGTPAPIEAVAGLFRGVNIGSGAQTVDFYYRPLSVRLGLAITASTALLSAMAFVLLKPKNVSRPVSRILS